MKVKFELSEEDYNKLVSICEEQNEDQNKVINDKINNYLGKLYRGEVDLDERINSRIELLEF